MVFLGKDKKLKCGGELYFSTPIKILQKHSKFRTMERLWGGIEGFPKTHIIQLHAA
jgi:hypothetical protein